MLSPLLRFFATGPDKAVTLPEDQVRRTYTMKRWLVFCGITFGYGFYYVARLSLSVVKKPMIDAGVLTAAELGKIGSILLLVYAFGKFFNGVLADRANIRRFMSAGLILSALVNLAFGFLSGFWVFFVLWALNGWFQAMGAAPSVVTLSQWFSRKERGTRYGVWYVSHSLGEGVTFIATSVVVGHFGWRYGFGTSGVLALAMGIGLLFLLSDRPQACGLPPITEFKREPVEATPAPTNTSLLRQQLEVLKYPAVWALGLASALTYVARYAINNWGILYLQEAKGYPLEEAGAIIGIAPVIGIAGGLLSGFTSDRLFASNRHKATLLYGLLQIAGLALFFYSPAGHKWTEILGIALFGFAVSGTVAFLGGLTAIDLTPRRVTGAVMGFIGLFSYMGAAFQDWASGAILEAGKTMVDGKAVYDFAPAIAFWFGSAVLSLCVAMTVWKAKPRLD